MKRLKWKTGILRTVLVYRGTDRIGHGYVIIHPDYNLGAPNIVNNEGTELEPDFYNLVIQSDEKLVYLNETVQ